MLTSSEAKWRCMWHMLVWSFSLTLVSQFLQITNHLAFYLLAVPSILLLPVITAVYSNTAGKHGAGLLRAGYVFCDPVLASLTITPILILNHLPELVDELICYQSYPGPNEWNSTLACLNNSAHASDIPNVPAHRPVNQEANVQEKKSEFLIIQGSVIVPVLLSMLMGRRTRKMDLDTCLLVASYWLIKSVEAGSLLEIVFLGGVQGVSPSSSESQPPSSYLHVVYMTEAIVTIAIILTNSYAVVTLCSYISPVGTSLFNSSSSSLSSSKLSSFRERFDIVYKTLVVAFGFFFVEIPLVVARVHIVVVGGASGAAAPPSFSATGPPHFLPGSFYMWLTADVLFLALVPAGLLLRRFGRGIGSLPCRPASFDNTDVFFQPEKRDVYLGSKHHTAMNRGGAEKRDIENNSKRNKMGIEENFRGASGSATLDTDASLPSRLPPRPANPKQKRVTFSFSSPDGGDNRGYRRQTAPGGKEIGTEMGDKRLVGRQISDDVFAEEGVERMGL